MPKVEKKFKLVNRGPAGLLNKIKRKDEPSENGDKKPALVGKVDWFAEGLMHLVVPIDLLTFDPDNARLHPERNMESIKSSLSKHGQQQVVVVQKWRNDVQVRTEATQTNRVVVGNGRLEAARQLGWTKIAASFVDMTDAQAAAYGLDDNRTSDLAKWNFAVVSRLEKLVTEAGGNLIGWNEDELEIMREADWLPPEMTDDEPDDEPHQELGIKFTKEELETVVRVIGKLREVLDLDENIADGECLRIICSDWLDSL